MRFHVSRFTLLILIFQILVVCANAKNIEPFIVSSPETVARLVIHSNEKEFVHTAAEVFAGDVLSVSDQKPEIKSSSEANYQIKVGTVGLNPGFDRECEANGIAVKRLKGKWETYILKVVQDKNKNILYVVGSQPRGTAYGLMELSRMIGVSPWIWWDDVHPQKKTTVSLPGNLSIQDGPKVKFRGIFINDEDWGIRPWASKTFEPEVGNMGPKTYAKIFELLLRLKANTIWPAMHPGTTPFFDVKGNEAMAQKYGIVVGTSHAEPMMRNNVGEWNTKTMGDFNYVTNRDSVYNYWKRRVEQVAKDNNIYTIGMRGVHDSKMEGAATLADEEAVLSRVFKDQRGLLKKYVNHDVSKVPQVFIPYKEVLPVYDYGLKVPDDVTLIWPDDNHGYIRRLSNEKERRRSGGAGVYYHISYWGRPHDYLWMESTPASLIWEEMHKAYETNARRIWIVNVGDIKANEIEMNFFLNMAWNPNQYSANNLDSWYSNFAETQFGKKYANEIGAILKKYFQPGFSRKPEHMGWNKVYPNTPINDPTLSLFNDGDEVQQRIDAYDKLEKQTDSLYTSLPDRLKDAFFELVAYKVFGASNMNKKILYAYKSREYAKQGRVVANQYADQSRQAFEKIKSETEKYNHQIAGGKWNRVISWQPRELPVFGMPKTGHVNPQLNAAGGVAPEGYSKPISPDSKRVSLPVFNKLTNRSYFIDVFNAGIEPLNWKAYTNQPWIKLSESSGLTSTQQRIWASVDWSRISSNDTVRTTLRFELAGRIYPIQIRAVKPEISGKNLFVEDNGVISMKAENFSEVSQKPNAGWKMIQGLGRTGDAMGTFPVTSPPFKTSDLSKAPTMTYDFYSASTGNATLLFYCLPSQPINADYQLRFAVSVDGGKPIIVNAVLKKPMDENNPEWQTNVLRAVTIQKCKITIPEKGKHTLKITMIDPGVVLDKIEINWGKIAQSYFGAPETISKI